ncbi:MAG: hypothetical protein NWQ69_08945 [Paracoccaceae bacterium]|jgi:uncharacterized membrane protein YraQ (UPF0718 family)|nr:hypothetical protein [Paracoccaceae bacterium]
MPTNSDPSQQKKRVNPAPTGEKSWAADLLADAFGWEFWIFFLVAAGFGVACYLVRGADVMWAALQSDLDMLLKLLPRLLVALSIAALIWVMLPRRWISGLVGSEAGWAGLVVATVAGALTPGGPSSAYPLLAVLGASGADRGAMVAYITSWAILGMQRVLIWDVPFLGAEFAILRTLVSLPLPILAGLIARNIPLTLTLRPITGASDAANSSSGAGVAEKGQGA